MTPPIPYSNLPRKKKDIPPPPPPPPPLNSNPSRKKTDIDGGVICLLPHHLLIDSFSGVVQAK